MESTQKRLEQIKSEGYQIDFSYTFNDAFDIYKRIALMAGLAFIVFAIVLAFLAGGIAMMLGIISGATQYFTPIDLASLSGVGLIVYIISAVILSGLISPFLAGIMKMSFNADRHEVVSFSDAFSCYRPPYFAPLFVQSILISLVSVGLSTAIQTFLPGFEWLGNVVSLTISFITMMTVPLIVFGNLQPVQAIQGSVAVVAKNPLTLLGLMVTAVILSFMGLIGLCIGVFFTFPFLYIMYYACYKHSVGITIHDEIEDIGEPDRF